MEYFGEYGGRVLRKIEGGGKQFIAGAVLTPTDVENWPLANRMALHRVGKVEWFGPATVEEANARTTKKETQGKVVDTPVTDKPVKTSTKPTVKASSRTSKPSKRG